MASVAQLFAEAVAWHRRAAAALLATGTVGRPPGVPALVGDDAVASARRLAARLDHLARTGLPGWLGCPLDETLREAPLGVGAPPGRPMYLRVGAARPVPDSAFPAVAPFVGVGHLSVDTDAGDPAVAGWLRAVLLRTVAALPDGALRVLPVDGATLGTVFAPFRPLVEAQAWAPPAVDLDGFRSALAEAERRVETPVPGGVLVLAVAAPPTGTGRAEWSRLAALAHAGPAAGVHLLLAGWPPPRVPGERPADLRHTTGLVAAGGGWYTLGEPAGAARFSDSGAGLPAGVLLDPDPPAGLVGYVCRHAAEAAGAAARTDLGSLLPERFWQESSANGLRAVVGRAGREAFEIRLDDTTPHLQLGGRSGAGKTNVLLVLLYALASRYSPDELGLYLLDFKEGVSFVEFTPTAADPSWIPHARAVGVESDREYGLAVLRALAGEMTRRAGELKAAGVTGLAALRAARPDLAMPRLVAVVDEFQVLFAGNDALARQAAGVLEELARKGRSYGIHLILASQTVAGIEALYTKRDSIFGQFPLRIALPGGSGILDPLNNAADTLPVGTAVVNTAAGAVGADTVVRFPHAEPAAVAARRHLLWAARPPGSRPPAVFAGYATARVRDDAAFQELHPGTGRRRALVGRAVEVGLPAAGFDLDAAPGRHVAVLGTDPAGAGVLRAATLGLARQHDPGSARFVLAGFDAGTAAVVDDLAATLASAGHDRLQTDPGSLRSLLGYLAGDAGTGSDKPTYLVVFAADLVVPLLAERGGDRRTGLDDLRTVLRSGPSRQVHLLTWWRAPRRFAEATGGSGGREDVACLVALNVPGTELAALTGDHTVDWHPRPNRALLLDRHDQRQQLIVPYTAGDRDEPTGARAS
jgi:S-DNA-T family DNA segregation ATPase FtsK/SpoIIIE